MPPPRLSRTRSSYRTSRFARSRPGRRTARHENVRVDPVDEPGMTAHRGRIAIQRSGSPIMVMEILVENAGPVGFAAALITIRQTLPKFMGWVDEGLVFNAKKVAQAISEVSDERGLVVQTKVTSPSILKPLLEAAVLEDDDVLRRLWAEMFANAIDANSKAEVRRAHISILQDCTRLDMEILAKLHAVEPGKDGRIVRTALLPANVAPIYPGHDNPVEGLPPPDVVRSLWNLSRLGLISGESTAIRRAIGVGDHHSVGRRAGGSLYLTRPRLIRTRIFPVLNTDNKTATPDDTSAKAGRKRAQKIWVGVGVALTLVIGTLAVVQLSSYGDFPPFAVKAVDSQTTRRSPSERLGDFIGGWANSRGLRSGW